MLNIPVFLLKNMCAIAGFVGFEDKELLGRMCDIQVHRGPDDYGYYIDKDVSLGHRRLSIIDLRTGKQPIHNEDESIWITYNGEIYNFKELKKELESKGHRFYTNTDTEVIIHQYEEDEELCVEKFRGMFAFALWDSNKKKLFLARDRLGIKPLYYSLNGNRILFASEIKGILLDKKTSREIDPIALDDFLNLRYIPAPRTIFKNIKKLLPGHFLVYQDGKAQIREFWDLHFDEQFVDDESYYMEKMIRLLEESVKMELISDVPLGAFLSGGIDSSTVVALMSKSMEQPVKTFSIGFEEESFNELKYARMVADHFSTEHHEFIVEPKSIDILPKLVWQMDEPFADFTALPLYYVSEMARKYVKVVLSGEGGDELFGGYPWYLPKPTDRLAHYFQKIPRTIQKIPLKVINLLPDANGHIGLTKKILHLSAMSDEDRFISRMSLLDDKVRNNLYLDSFHQQFKTRTEDVLKFYFRKTDARIFLNKLFYVDIKTFLRDDILVQVDKTGMLNSIETRPPIIDHKLVEFAASVPPHLKINGDTTKYLFRKAVKSLLPKEIIQRKKWGFTLPLHHWLSGELKDLPSLILLDERTRNRDYFRRDYIEKLLSKFKDNSKAYSPHIARLMILELWFRTYIDREDISRPSEKLLSEIVC